MRFPIGPLFAELCMSESERKLMQQSDRASRSITYLRYVNELLQFSRVLRVFCALSEGLKETLSWTSRANNHLMNTTVS